MRDFEDRIMSMEKTVRELESEKIMLQDKFSSTQDYVQDFIGDLDKMLTTTDRFG